MTDLPDEATVRRIVAKWGEKYGMEWRSPPRDETLRMTFLDDEEEEITVDVLAPWEGWWDDIAKFEKRCREIAEAEQQPVYRDEGGYYVRTHDVTEDTYRGPITELVPDYHDTFWEAFGDIKPT